MNGKESNMTEYGLPTTGNHMTLLIIAILLIWKWKYTIAIPQIIALYIYYSFKSNDTTSNDELLDSFEIPSKK